MKIMEIEIDDETYEEIINILLWINQDRKLTHRSDGDFYKVKDFISGSIITQVDIIKKFLIKPYDNIDKEIKFKNRFKEIAKERNIRQVDICKKLGIQKSNLSNIFNNEMQPRAELFFKIWALLECPPIQQCIYFETE